MAVRGIAVLPGDAFRKGRRGAAFAAALVLAGAMPARAGSPAEGVRPFYEHPGLERDPAARDRFRDPALAVLDEADALERSGEGSCLDPNLAIDSPDYDAAEIRRTLKLAESVHGGKATVMAAFTVKGENRRIEWKLVEAGGDWKVTDILSVTGEWALSQYHCE